MPNWHAPGKRNEVHALAISQCAHIARTFGEVLFKYHDCGSTRLVTFAGNNQWLALDVETLMAFIGQFYFLDGYFEEEQAQRLFAYLVSNESPLAFAN